MASAAMTAFDDGPLHIDFERQEVTIAANPIELTSQEYDLLAAFVSDRSQVLSYERIADLDPRRGVVRHVAAKYACVGLHRKLGLSDDDLWGGVIQHVSGVGFQYKSGRFP